MDQSAATSSGVHRIDGPIQHYPWGDTEFLPRFLGRSGDGRPWAEWWLGTHPHGPAVLEDGTQLLEVSGPLGFLVKVLAAAQPLSLQVHPDSARAATGYAQGRYGDPHPKPELIHALTEFEAFCGIRPADSTIQLLVGHGLDALAAHLRSHGVAATMAAILNGRFDIASTVDLCKLAAERPGAHRSISWVARLADLHPGDPAVAATLLLHYVQLQPGEALRLTAGTLHAYLGGAGIEVMAPSDNVVRCGLTAKATDIDEALAILDSREVLDPRIPADAPQGLPEIGVELRHLPAGSTHTAVTALIAVTADGRAFFIEAGAHFVCEADSHLVG